MKKCSRCNIHKDFENFRKANTKDGYFGYCIECNKEHQKEWKAKNKEKTKKYMTEYHKSYYQENKEKIDEKNKNWAKNNHEKMKEYFDRYVEKPGVREKRNLKTSEWGKMNPENNREKCKRRSESIKSTSDGSINTESLRIILVNQGYKCNLCSCNISESYEKDHIIPLSKGGKHIISNIQYLCGLCNRKKGTSIL